MNYKQANSKWVRREVEKINWGNKVSSVKGLYRFTVFRSLQGIHSLQHQ